MWVKGCNPPSDTFVKALVRALCSWGVGDETFVAGVGWKAVTWGFVDFVGLGAVALRPFPKRANVLVRGLKSAGVSRLQVFC